jgi:regulator of sirC expression with transglutaminase-like and TPR domain
MHKDQREALSVWADCPDDVFDVPAVLWDLARLDHNEIAIEDAQDIIRSMVASLPPEDDMGILEQHAALVRVIHQEFGFTTDDPSGQPEHMDFVSVVQRKRGLAVALGAIYLALAQARDWSVMGINFPGHFLIQMGQGQSRILIDPVQGDILQASDLRRLLKETLGVHAELQHNHYQQVTPRAWVIRLYNNRKTALLQDGHVLQALDVVKALLCVAPFEARLFYDAAVLATRLDHLREAIEYWDKFIVLSDDKAEITEAKYIVGQLRGMLS